MTTTAQNFRRLDPREIVLVLDDRQTRVPPASILLVPYGDVAFTKGEERGYYEFGPEDADKVLADFATRGKDLVVDYEHQTLTGNTAPAAGWIDRLEKTAAGVVGHVKYWTASALKHLSSGEYRYHSPVLYTSRRHPTALHSVALTNHPATHGLPALVASDLADASDPELTETQTKEQDMKHLKELAERLGLTVVALADGALDEVATLAAIIAKIDAGLAQDKAITEFLKLHDAADLGALTGKIKGMVPAAELTALNDRLAGIEADKAVTAAFAARKLVEAQRTWAQQYARTNLQAFNDFVTAAPVVAPAAASTVPATQQSPAVLPMSDSERKVYKTLGLSDAQINELAKATTAKV